MTSSLYLGPKFTGIILALSTKQKAIGEKEERESIVCFEMKGKLPPTEVKSICRYVMNSKLFELTKDNPDAWVCALYDFCQALDIDVVLRSDPMKYNVPRTIMAAVRYLIRTSLSASVMEELNDFLSNECFTPHAFIDCVRKKY